MPRGATEIRRPCVLTGKELVTSFLNTIVNLCSIWVDAKDTQRSWSSGYDRRLPSDGPGFNSRRAQVFAAVAKYSTSPNPFSDHSAPVSAVGSIV